MCVWSEQENPASSPRKAPCAGPCLSQPSCPKHRITFFTRLICATRHAISFLSSCTSWCCSFSRATAFLQNAGKADLVRELLSPSQSLQARRRAEARVLEPPFPSLSLLCECFPSAPASAKGEERERHEAWALRTGEQTAQGRLLLPHHISCGPGEGSYHMAFSWPTGCSSST